MCRIVPMEVRGSPVRTGSFLPPWEPRGSNSSCRAQWQMPEASHHPCKFLVIVFSHYPSFCSEMASIYNSHVPQASSPSQPPECWHYRLDWLLDNIILLHGNQKVTSSGICYHEHLLALPIFRVFLCLTSSIWEEILNLSNQHSFS